jgi:hypothetical protein
LLQDELQKLDTHPSVHVTKSVVIKWKEPDEIERIANLDSAYKKSLAIKCYLKVWGNLYALI